MQSWNWDQANDMREHRFTPAETVDILERAGKMTNGYFATLVIVNCYWNLLPRRTADILEATNISNPVKTSMHKLCMSVGMQDWLFMIETEQDWLDFGESSETSELSRHWQFILGTYSITIVQILSSFMYVNIAKLQFAEAPTPASQLDQLGIDLLQCILAANVEEYYDDALTEVEKDSYGPNLKMRATPDAKKIIFFHEFKERYIVLDGHFTLEIVSKAHATAAEITKLSKKVLQSATTLTKGARWTNKLYTEGVRSDYSDTSLLRRIDLLITEIDTCFKSNAMSEHVRHLRRITHNRCIHCTSFSHESVDHHLSLGIFHVPGNPHPYIYSTPSMKNDVTSQGTPDMGIEGTDKKEQPAPQSITSTTVNTLTCPSQLPIPLPSPSPPTTSTPLTATPASPKSINSSRTLPTCNPTSASLLQATFHQVRSLRMNMSGRRSAYSSKRNRNTSRPSSRLSISSTPMTPRLKSSTTSPASSTMDHGEPSHGDHHCPGPSPSNSPSPLPHQIHPLPMKPTVSKINATRYCPQVHRCHTHQTFDTHIDFIDDDHDDILSIFGEEVLHNIDQRSSL